MSDSPWSTTHHTGPDGARISLHRGRATETEPCPSCKQPVDVSGGGIPEHLADGVRCNGSGAIGVATEHSIQDPFTDQITVTFRAF